MDIVPNFAIGTVLPLLNQYLNYINFADLESGIFENEETFISSFRCHRPFVLRGADTGLRTTSQGGLRKHVHEPEGPGVSYGQL